MMIELQKFLFETVPKRIELMNYTPLAKEEYVIHIYRNHSFELIEHTIPAYLDYAGIKGKFSYSDYDDSLSFYNIDMTADMIILWLDMTRYSESKIEDFLRERLKYLSSIYQKPILFVPFEGKLLEIGGNVFCYDLSKIKVNLKEQYIDKRLETISGTKLSAKSCMEISKELGLKYIPSLLKPALKAIVIDLDNTLYKGVLGEDGEYGLDLSGGYIELQEFIKELKKQGFFICIASKNEKQDVEKLFSVRQDFPLQKEDFAMICASWKPKAEMIGEIAAYLNIHTDSILFVDDNIGELLSVKEVYQTIHMVHASDNPQVTYKVLTQYPRLWKPHHQQEDDIRTADIKAKQSRVELQQSLSKEEYLKSLQIELEYGLNDKEKAERVAELANKTNQFIFNYMRYTLSEVQELMKEQDSLVVSIKLKDRLSDSGMIGACIFKSVEEGIVLEECFVSCRALGRGIEEIIILGSICLAQKHFMQDKVKVLFKHGERNTPAENFIHQFLADCVEKFGKVGYELPNDLVKISVKKEGEN